MKIINRIKKHFSKKPIKIKRGFLFVQDNIRKVKGEELNTIKLTIQNYVGDGILTRLITSKANQIKDEAIKKCYKDTVELCDFDEAVKQSGLVMMQASYKIKGLEELVDEIKFFAKKDQKNTVVERPHEPI